MNKLSKIQDLNEPMLMECNSFENKTEEAGLRSLCPSFFSTESKSKKRQKCRNASFEQATIDEVKRRQMQDENKAASIDFKQMFHEYRARTERSAPHIYIQVEDTMFITSTKLVTLEYVFYAKDEDEKGRLTHLCLKDSTLNILATLLADKKDKVYCQKPLCFQESAENHLDENKNLLEASDNSMVEVLISSWDVNINGQLMKDKEVSFKCGSQFRPLQKLKLQLSNDAKYILLPIVSAFVQEDETLKKSAHFQKIELLFWEASTLTEKKFPQLEPQLLKLPSESQIGTFESLTLGGKNQYLVIKFKSKKSQNNFIFKTQTGEMKHLIFDFNTPISLIINKHNEGSLRVSEKDKKVKFKEPNKNYFMMDFLIDETDNQQRDQEEADQDQEILKLPVSNQKIHARSKTLAAAQIKSILEEAKQSNRLTNDLKLIFFFFGNLAGSSTTEVQEDVQIGFFKYNLQDINSRNSETQKYNLNKLNFLVKIGFDRQYLNIPVNWYITERGKLHAWHESLKITITKHFDKIAILNKAKGQYYAFHVDKCTPFAKQQLAFGADTIIDHGRNQQTKENLMVIERTSNHGSNTFVYIDKDVPQMIKFDIDDLEAIQDTHVIHYTAQGDDNKLQQMFLLQSSSISRADDQVLLRTHSSNTGGKDTVRKSKPQSIVSSFPITMYNIGIQKLVIQTYLEKGTRMIYKIGENENFVDFIEFNNLTDLGFNVKGLRIEACSRFAFLTLNKKSQRMFVNVLFVDPYYTDTEICVFKSKKSFMFESLETKDVIVKSIMYEKAGQDLIILLQQPEYLHRFTLEDTSEDLIANDKGSGIEIKVPEFESEADEYASSDDINDQGFRFAGTDLAALKQYHDCRECIKQSLPTPIIKGPQGKIYYVIDCQGVHQVIEINPLINCANNEVVVFEKNEPCCRLHIEGDVFYYMTPSRQIIKLQMQYDNHVLIEIKQLSIQVKDRPNFKVLSNENTIISDNYIIQGSKIFYLSDYESDEDKKDNIYNMEFLQELPDLDKKGEKNYMSGPYKISGSDYFMCMFKYGHGNVTKGSGVFRQKIYQLPDSQNTPMLQDVNRVVTMSTFLDEENILVTINGRYMLFKKSGMFNQCVKFRDQDDDGKTIVVDRLNNMNLLQLSGNQKFFLFQDKTKTFISVYTLITIDNQMIFILVFKTDLMKYFTWNKPLEEYSASNQDGDKSVLKDVTNEGKVNVSYCVTTHYPEVMTKVQVKVWLFSNPQIKGPHLDGQNINWKSYYVTKSIDQSFSFPHTAVTNVYTFLDMYFGQLQTLYDIEYDHQKSLPFIFKNSDELESLNCQINYIQKRYEQVAMVHILGDLIYVSCGRFIQYGKLEIISPLVLKFPQMVFNANVEIYQMRKTTQENIVQVVTKNGFFDEMTILTWDFNKDIERSIFQVSCDKSIRPERHIIKGLIQKCNYYVAQKEIFDLEFCIPIQKIARSTKQNHQKSKVIRSKKLYVDGSRYLGLVSQNEIRFPITRMDLLFWLNVLQLNTSQQMIVKLSKLGDFQKIFNDRSLFHHFGSNTPMIMEIHKKYSETINNLQSKEDELLPLTLLFPDSSGLTALDWAQRKKRPKVFELMLDMIRMVKNNYPFSKMILNSLPLIIQEESLVIYRFFDDCVFQPVGLQQAIIMRWPDDLDEFVCARPSALITENELENYLIDQGLLQIDQSKEHGVTNEQTNDRSTTNTVGEYRSTELVIKNDDDTSIRRVNVEIISFDWIFEADNASKMISILASNATPQLLVQKSNKAFIDLMWQSYQPRILWTQFIPYMIFMILFTVITQTTSGGYLTVLANVDHLERISPIFIETRVFVSIISFMCFFFVIHNFLREFRDMLQDGIAYFDDPWNWLDFSITLTSTTYLFRIFVASIIGHTGEITPVFFRAHGAVAAFLIGIKVFYWMRLFKSSAFFIRLIVETLADVKVFVGLMFVILYAFANFFLILNTNDNPEEKYYQVVFGIDMIDALLSMYMLSLGEFNIDQFRMSANRYVAWVFFLLASFLILLVFVNMLIAIMGSTFGNVYDNQEENALFEQLMLMEDYLWAVDLQHKYTNMKYIIKVSPEVSSQDQSFANEEDPIQQIKETLCRQMVEVNTKLDTIIKSQRKINK